MPVLDLFLPDDLPVEADADLGRALASAVDQLTDEASPPCTVFAHRLPVFAVHSAQTEGVRTVRVQVSCDAGPWLGLAPVLDQVVNRYLRRLTIGAPVRVVVSVQTVTESNAMSWPPPLRSLSG